MRGPIQLGRAEKRKTPKNTSNWQITLRVDRQCDTRRKKACELKERSKQSERITDSLKAGSFSTKSLFRTLQYLWNHLTAAFATRTVSLSRGLQFDANRLGSVSCTHATRLGRESLQRVVTSDYSMRLFQTIREPFQV